MFSKVIKDALMITGFVFIMMLVIEYLNVQTRGAWQKLLTGKRWRQYILAAILGLIPGCLGSFAVVTMYTHRILTLGALVTAMITTSGDEAFVMFALFPKQALLLHGVLLIIGLGGGLLTDLVFPKSKLLLPDEHDLPLHTEYCDCFPHEKFWSQLRELSLQRFLLVALMVMAVVAFATGYLGEAEWNWVRVTLLLVSLTGLFIVLTVPDHFLEEHLWRHVARRHLPKIFFWTLGALILLEIVINRLHLEQWLSHSYWLVFGIAALVGLIPESGPHLIFVTMYARGLIPFAILLTNSIVQDGHGALPLLAHSRRQFMRVKLINLLIGLLAGAVFLWYDW